MKKGQLTIIPTPLDEIHPLEGVAKALLLKACEDAAASIFIIEDLRPGRRRWLQWGLPREQVEDFELLNEHNYRQQTLRLLQFLQLGKNLYLMSDGGLPAFCDPGRELIAACHEQNIKVTATPFQNSVVLALALSGFPHHRFVFEGFIPVKTEQRVAALQSINRQKSAVILMDTPYRLKNLLLLIKDIAPSRRLFLAMGLNCPDETLLLGNAQKVIKNIGHFKREFILILAPVC